MTYDLNADEGLYNNLYGISLHEYILKNESSGVLTMAQMAHLRQGPRPFQN